MSVSELLSPTPAIDRKLHEEGSLALRRLSKDAYAIMDCRLQGEIDLMTAMLIWCFAGALSLETSRVRTDIQYHTRLTTVVWGPIQSKKTYGLAHLPAAARANLMFLIMYWRKALSANRNGRGCCGWGSRGATPRPPAVA